MLATSPKVTERPAKRLSGVKYMSVLSVTGPPLLQVLAGPPVDAKLPNGKPGAASCGTPTIFLQSKTGDEGVTTRFVVVVCELATAAVRQAAIVMVRKVRMNISILSMLTEAPDGVRCGSVLFVREEEEGSIHHTPVGMTRHIYLGARRGAKGRRLVTITRKPVDRTVTTVTSAFTDQICSVDQPVAEEGLGDDSAAAVTVESAPNFGPSPGLAKAISLNGRGNQPQVAEVT